MSQASSASPLDEFAAAYIAPFSHYREVRTEHLADAVRRALELPPFPSYEDVVSLCERWGIERGTLRTSVPGLRGFNQRYGTAAPSILLDPELRPGLAATTMLHELREVLENAFAAAKPSYTARATHDNDSMNSVSDRFAGYVLMPTAASHELMANVGYDLLEFSRQTARSLPSVLLRMRELYSKKSEVPGPVMGAWLFDAGWEVACQRATAAADMRITYRIALSGFSQRKGTPESQVFPGADCCASQFNITLAAVEAGRPVIRELQGIDPSGERDYVLVAEPEVRFNKLWRVLLTAVRRSDEQLIQPWLDRLRVPFAPAWVERL